MRAYCEKYYILCLCFSIILAPQHLSSQGKPAAGPPVVFVKVLPNGFEPPTLTVPPGPVHILIHNRSGIGTPVIRLDKEGAGRLQQIQGTKYRSSVQLVQTLSAGVHTITEANHPGWQCKLIVRAK